MNIGVRFSKDGIILHDQKDFLSMRKAGSLASKTLDFIAPYVVAGITTNDLNSLCHDFIVSNNAIPAPLHYRGFPKSICTSINHVVCHGIPSDKKLKEGDIINIDVTVIVDGWHGDTSRMFCVGKISRLSQKLVDVTYEAMMRAIDIVKPGVYLGDIGHIIESFAHSYGYSVVEDFCGHGIGKDFHTEPMVLHYGKPFHGIVLEEGMFFTIEPMINAGKKGVKVLSDGWTAVTRDGSSSAQFEHTIGVTQSGYEIFTVSDNIN
jgi:methionyl aminopeptidase